jgi:FkbM family methyltransferase
MVARIRRATWKLLHVFPQLEIVVRTRHGRLGFSNKDHGVGRRLFINREYEWSTLEKAVECAVAAGALSRRNPGLLLDVGANLGTTCIPLVSQGVFAGAIAVEPEPVTYRHLVRNVARNGLADVIRTFNCALSSTNGTMSMELSTNSGDNRLRVGGASGAPAHYREERRPVITVSVHRLDDLLPTVPTDPEDIALIWMDVQGHERHVLEGAPRTLTGRAPVVAELWPYGLARAGVAPEAFVKTVAAHFDRFYDLGDEAPVARPITHIERLFHRHEHFKSFTDLLLLPA